jgi:hypothetical protein
MKPSQLLFFREFLGSFFESIFLHGLIDSTTHTRLSRWCQTAEAKEYATRLFREGTVDLPEYLLTLKLVQLREMDGKEFDHIQIIFISTSERPRTNCFVGHKFSPQVDKTLRWNLRQILEPYNVELEWSGRDLRSVQILDNIVRQIKTAASASLTIEPPKEGPTCTSRREYVLPLRNRLSCSSASPTSEIRTSPVLYPPI